MSQSPESRYAIKKNGSSDIYPRGCDARFLKLGERSNFETGEPLGQIWQIKCDGCNVFEAVEIGSGNTASGLRRELGNSRPPFCEKLQGKLSSKFSLI